MCYLCPENIIPSFALTIRHRKNILFGIVTCVWKISSHRRSRQPITLNTTPSMSFECRQEVAAALFQTDSLWLPLASVGLVLYLLVLGRTYTPASIMPTTTFLISSVGSIPAIERQSYTRLIAVGLRSSDLI